MTINYIVIMYFSNYVSDFITLKCHFFGIVLVYFTCLVPTDYYLFSI